MMEEGVAADQPLKLTVDKLPLALETLRIENVRQINVLHSGQGTEIYVSPRNSG